MSMSEEKPMSFRFMIDNMSEKEKVITSKTFESGGCEWCVRVYPKVHLAGDNHMALYLSVGNIKTLPCGWKRSLTYYFIVLNQSHKELFRTPTNLGCFSPESPSQGYRETLPFSKFEEQGFLENDKLIIEIHILKNVQVLDKASSVRFQFLVVRILEEHPDIVPDDYFLMNKEIRTAFMNILLEVIDTLEKPTKSLSETMLSMARIDLNALKDAGFKTDWLNLRLSLHEEKKKKKQKKNMLKAAAAAADVSLVQQLEERVENLEEVMMMKKKSNDKEVGINLKLKCFDRKTKKLECKLDSLEIKIQELEERLLL